MNVCLICRENLTNDNKSVDDFVADGIQIKNILIDCNFKFPFEDSISTELCNKCYCHLEELHSFKIYCSMLIQFDEQPFDNCQICGLTLENLFLSSDYVVVNGNSLTMSDILDKICFYKDDNMKICKICKSKLMDVYYFYLKCAEALEFWTNHVSKSSGNRNSPNLGMDIIKLEEECAFSTDSVKKNDSEEFVHEHKKRKTQECYICSKTFGQKGTLRIHMRIHTGEKPFKCEICSKSIRAKSDFECHVRSHTGEKPYKCKICSRPFNQRNNMKSHMRLHSGEKPYKCEICSKSFAQNSNLMQHLAVHTGEKSIQCGICDKSIRQKRYFKIHLRTHTGEKPYKCEKCSKSFTQTPSLKRHLRRSHYDEE